MITAFRFTFRILAALLGVYNLMCIVRIIMTWIPSMQFNSVTNFLSKVCDPYLNLFRKCRFLIIGNFDFTPALAMCVLGAASSLFTSFANAGTISVGIILSILLELVWAVISSLVTFFLLVLAVRLIILLVNKNNYRSNNIIIEQIDKSISPILYTIGKTFTAGRKITYKTALIISIVVFTCVLIAGTVLFEYLASLLARLPF